jgi:uncharacterized protein (TIGR03382 family)
MYTNSIALAGAISTFALTSTALGGLNGLSYDVIGVDLIPDTYTVRLYAEVDAGNRVDAIYGDDIANFSITMYSDASTYQNTMYGGATSRSISSAFFSFVPSLEWDSYVTIGCLYSDGMPFDNNALQHIGIDWAGFEAGGDATTNNGTWFVTPADGQGGEMGGRVLIAQFTIYQGSGDYDMYFTAGFQGKDADGVTWNGADSVEISIPAPGALALLGLAGVASRRRRRS